MNTKYLDETEQIVSRKEIENHFYNEMTNSEREEYDNDFNNYLICCMWYNGGTLTPYNEQEYTECN